MHIYVQYMQKCTQKIVSNASGIARVNALQLVLDRLIPSRLCGQVPSSRLPKWHLQLAKLVASAPWSQLAKPRPPWGTFKIDHKIHNFQMSWYQPHLVIILWYFLQISRSFSALLARLLRMKVVKSKGVGRQNCCEGVTQRACVLAFTFTWDQRSDQKLEELVRGKRFPKLIVKESRL